MLQTKRLLLSISVAVAMVSLLVLNSADAARPFEDHAVSCVIDVEVESKNQTGTVIGTEVYHQEFLLQEGEVFSEDFSTRTRFKFFDATFSKLNGDRTISINWFADVTVFNSVDCSTSVVLSDGDKSGKAVGENTVYTSAGSTRTKFTLTCTED